MNSMMNNGFGMNTMGGLGGMGSLGGMGGMGMNMGGGYY